MDSSEQPAATTCTTAAPSASTLTTSKTVVPEHMARLPSELIQEITTYLPNSDIKNLRLSCRFFRDLAPLRLHRVFLSANPLNIEVFRAVADHEKFRYGVLEIIWDDARFLHLFKTSDTSESASDESDDDPLIDRSLPETHDYLARRHCIWNTQNLHTRFRNDVVRPDHVARMKQLEASKTCRSSKFIKQLVEQQNIVLETGDDAKALEYGLRRFPKLRRITITPAAHGFLFTPLYQTPMIRSFPSGFNYPIPRTWPRTNRGHSWAGEEYKDKWRGFRIVTRALAQQVPDAGVTELIIDVSLLGAGLTCRIFDKRSFEEYQNLATILKRPGFSRIDLSLLVDDMHDCDWTSFRRGLLREALAGARDLRHVSLKTNVEEDPAADAEEDESAGSSAHFVPLRTIFPIEKWPRLEHFGLFRFLVKQQDVLSLLAALPETLRSVELSSLMFLDGGGCYRDLLAGMRDRLGWRERPAERRPRVSVVMDEGPGVEGRAVWIDREVEAYLYGDGENPFEEDGHCNTIAWGKGIERDLFEPAHERPFVNPKELMRMGIREKSSWVLTPEEMKA